ncbi:hypothetical protein AZ012_003170 [Citrobacter amalonaticus]|nr:hypothetical protein AZ012_003170 [Citrobacter amalonaticus]
MFCHDVVFHCGISPSWWVIARYHQPFHINGLIRKKVQNVGYNVRGRPSPLGGGTSLAP